MPDNNKDTKNESELQIKSGKKGLTSKEYNVFFGYVLISTIVIVFLFSIIIWRIWCTNYKFSFDFQDTIPVILSVIGIFIAFTAINIYSVFNSRVSEEKKELEDLKLEYKVKINELNNNYELINSDIKQIKDTFPYQLKLKDVVENLDIEKTLSSILDDSVLILERTTNVWKLIGILNGKKKEITKSILKYESYDLADNYKIFKRQIKSKFGTRKFTKIKSTEFQSALNQLIEILNEDDITN
jgi:hypothetical protein